MKAGQETAALQKAVRHSIDQLNGLFKVNPSEFFREAELHSKLYGLLMGDPVFSHGAKGGSRCLVHQEYATPFRCDMGDMRFEVLEDEARGRRGHYDLIVLNPWWLGRVPLDSLRSDDFAAFRQEIRDKAGKHDPPLCLVGIEMHLVRTERPRKGDYDRILQDYRKLLHSGTLASGWRFMDHRYVLVYSHHSQPHEAKWRELVQAAWERDVDPKNAWVAWTSPRGIRWSG